MPLRRFPTGRRNLLSCNTLRQRSPGRCGRFARLLSAPRHRAPSGPPAVALRKSLSPKQFDRPHPLDNSRRFGSIGPVLSLPQVASAQRLSLLLHSFSRFRLFWGNNSPTRPKPPAVPAFLPPFSQRIIHSRRSAVSIRISTTLPRHPFRINVPFCTTLLRPIDTAAPRPGR